VSNVRRAATELKDLGYALGGQKCNTSGAGQKVVLGTEVVTPRATMGEG
jgi:hypothetical protein